MPLAQFVAYTAAGSLLWNGLLVGAGYGLGTQWDKVEGYASWLDWILIGALVLAVGALAWRRWRTHRSRVPGGG